MLNDDIMAGVEATVNVE